MTSIKQIFYFPNPVDGAPLGTVVVGDGDGLTVCALDGLLPPCIRKIPNTNALITNSNNLIIQDTSSP